MASCKLKMHHVWLLIDPMYPTCEENHTWADVCCKSYGMIGNLNCIILIEDVTQIWWDCCCYENNQRNYAWLIWLNLSSKTYCDWHLYLTLRFWSVTDSLYNRQWETTWYCQRKWSMAYLLMRRLSMLNLIHWCNNDGVASCMYSTLFGTTSMSMLDPISASNPMVLMPSLRGLENMCQVCYTVT